MKRIINPLFAFLFLLLAHSASAQDYKTAIGIRLSSNQAIVNNSISFKYFLSENKAVEALLSLGDPLAIGALYQIHNPLSAEGLKWFYGGGAYLGFVKEFNRDKQVNETNPQFGAQGVVGLDYKFANIPLNLALDWKPELNLVEDINFEPAAIGLTARFTF